MPKFSIALLLTVLVLLAPSARSEAPATRPALYPPTAAAFFASGVADAKIDPARVDRALLAAAVFHETNRVRLEHHLRPLTHAAKLDEAAKMHADDMAGRGYFAHENPTDPARKTPWDRVKLTGYDPQLVAENLATAFALDYKSGSPAYAKDADGKRTLSATPDGPPLPMRTYAGLARSVVDGWMHSPPHRHNLLSPEPTQLGTDCSPAAKLKPDERGFHKFYCAQEFGVPRG